MRTMLPRVPIRPLAVVAVLAAVAVTASAQAPSAVRAEKRSGWFAGDSIDERVSASADARAAAAHRAEALGRALGFAGRPGAVTRVFNRIESRTLDEVDLLAATGRVTAHFKLDAASGAVRSAVQLDWQRGFDRLVVDAAAAPRRAEELAAAAGVAVPASEATVEWDDGMTAWHVRWARTIDGVPAAGATSIWVFPGGQLKAIALVEQPTGEAPEAIVERAVASDAVRAYIAANRIDRFAGLVVDPPKLRWVAANDFVATERPDAAEATLRLAWVVAFRYDVPGWRLPHEVELYVDAGSGEIIGGAETA